MAIFDFLRKNNPAVNKRVTSGGAAVLGIQGTEIEDTIDDELPSVNRRKGKSKFVDALGFATILGAGLTMLYFINAPDEKKVEAKPKKMQIQNSLPPLVLPPPTVPEPLPVVENKVPALGSQQPIPLQSLNQGGAQSNAKRLPTWSDRKMTGNVLIGSQSGSAGAADKTAVGANDSATGAVVASAPDASPLALKLKPTISKGVSAGMLPNRDYLITKGTALDCALETALDSTVPGMTTCRLTRDVYSDNGHVVLLDRGSQLVGEYQGGLTQGQARIFVLWTRAKTPNGVIVNLDSPGTDTLGRSGHNGWVDNHFMERFGAAILLSLVRDGLQIARQNNNTSVNIGGGGSDQLSTEILRNTINIPPTLYINQGDHIQVMVGRDLDFSTVYGLELKEEG